MTDEIESLEDDLRALEARKSDLQERIQKREKRRLELRDAISEGNEEAIQEATRLRTELNALKSSRNEVAEKIGATRKELQRARREAEHEEDMERLAELAEKATEARKKHDEAFKRAAETLAEEAKNIRKAFKEWEKATDRFYRASHAVVPHFGNETPRGKKGAQQKREQRGLIKQLRRRGVDLGDVLSNQVLGKGQTRMNLERHVHDAVGPARQYSFPKAGKSKAVQKVIGRTDE
jgi:chromosome segregation ATPase